MSARECVAVPCIGTERAAHRLGRHLAIYYFPDEYREVQALIDNPASEQEQRIGSAFAKSNFYRVTPSFIRFTNNADGFPVNFPASIRFPVPNAISDLSISRV